MKLSRNANSDFNEKSFGVYQLTREIKRDLLFTFYLAERADGVFRRRVLVKTINKQADPDSFNLTAHRFREERQIYAELNHPNIIQMLDGGTTEDGVPYVVMEYIEGEPLLVFCQRLQFDLKQKLRLFLEICAAVSYSHKHKIIHPDLTPVNIIVTENGTPKLISFQNARMIDSDSADEIPASGTIRSDKLSEYVSDEVLSDVSDQYRLGVLLCELLTGAQPDELMLPELTEIVTVTKTAQQKSVFFEKLFKFNAVGSDGDIFSVSRNLENIIRKALRKDLINGYSAVSEFAAEIKKLIDSLKERSTHQIGSNKVFQTSTDEIKNTESDFPTRSIAVLPFKILDTGQANIEDLSYEQFLSIGLADALITRLSRLRQLLVRPTNSVLRYAGKDFDFQKVGNELNVAFILFGDIRRIDREINFSVQLVDAQKQSVVWSKKIAERVTDILELEDLVSTSVVESLLPELPLQERQRQDKRGTDSLAAYEAYLHGRFHWNNFTEQSFQQAIQYYRQAVELDPGYALAYAGIADYYIWLGIFGLRGREQSFAAARQTAERAVLLDDSLAEGYAALGFAELCSEYEWVTSEKNIRRAIQINPNYSVAHNWLAFFLFAASRFEEGIYHAQEAIKLDPFTYQNYRTLAWGYYFSRDFDQALATITLTIEKFPSVGTALASRSWLLRAMGRTEESLSDSFECLKSNGSNVFVLLGHMQTLAAAGQLAAAEELLNDLKLNPRVEYISPYQIALIYCYAGQKEKALELLEYAYSIREGWLIWLDVEPALDFIRNEPRFRRLLEKLHKTTKI